MLIILMFLIILIIATASFIYTSYFSDASYSYVTSFDFVRYIATIFSFIGLIISLLCYISSYHEALYINKQFGTNLSTDDIFYNKNLVLKQFRNKDVITDENLNLNIKNK